MARSTPPRPSPTVVAIVAVLCLAVLLYAVLAMGNLLVGLFPALVAVAAYIGWRVLLAIEAIAASLQRIATALEDED